MLYKSFICIKFQNKVITKRPIIKEVEEIEEIEQIDQPIKVQRLEGHRRGNKERERHEEESQHENELDTNRDCGVGGYKKRNRRSHEEIQYENEFESNGDHEISEVIAKPFISNNEFNDIDSNYEDIESDIVPTTSKTTSRSIYNSSIAIRATAPTMQIYKSMIDSELYGILTMKSPVRNRNKNGTQQQDKVTFTDLLQIFESDNSDNDAVESYKQKTGIPKALRDMTNIFEVCHEKMKNAMNTLLNSPTTTVPQSATSNDLKPGLARLWHEEIKCLFLRYRNPSTGAIESLITEIFKYELYTALVLEFKEKQSREQQMLIPSRTNINEFITQEVVRQVLKRYLSGTNIDRLKRCGTMDKLVTLIREAFKICFNVYSTKAIKELDYITIDCKIPSRSGKNIASRLSIPNSLV
ncbi:35938_t:CDS:10 [Gigaspora margarita]|uniref:35938_t:CDS:1 n=1 Tax=Gigaspora margarita TaxID=4874 RepID=A0ABN7UYR2_GIGMA|nr:35938_t:CDS:10 [Gigaspora margarita]